MRTSKAPAPPALQEVTMGLEREKDAKTPHSRTEGSKWDNRVTRNVTSRTGCLSCARAA